MKGHTFNHQNNVYWTDDKTMIKRRHLNKNINIPLTISLKLIKLLIIELKSQN